MLPQEPAMISEIPQCRLCQNYGALRPVCRGKRGVWSTIGQHLSNKPASTVAAPLVNTRPFPALDCGLHGVRLW